MWWYEFKSDMWSYLWTLLHINITLHVSAVVNKHFVDKIGDKTAILRKHDMYMYVCQQKILFFRHNNVLFWKRKDTFKKKL